MISFSKALSVLRLSRRLSGKPYSTLLREVNPYDTGAKLGAETLMHIMKTTGNVTPLEKMALEMGYRLEPAEGMGSTVRA